MRRLFLLATALALPLLASAPATRADDYQPWQGPYNSGNPNQPGDIGQLVHQLRQLIAKAEKAKAADPNFLRDLKNLANSYDQGSMQILSDNFNSGQYPDSRRWKVIAGDWRIVTQPAAGLGTQVNTRQNGNNTQNLVNGLLGALISPQGNNQNQNQQGNNYAGLQAPVAIPNAFTVHFEFSSSEDATRFDVGTYRDNNDGAYFLSYMPTAPRGFMLSRSVPGQGTQQIAYSPGIMNLNGRGFHAVDWKRERDGRMTVAVDGQPLIDVTDTAVQKSFDGFVMGNNGGFYIIRNVSITGRRNY
jgi:hypothetical protein